MAIQGESAMERVRASGRRGVADPRHGQLLVLSALLVHGCVNLDFEAPPAATLSMLAAALLTQWLFSRFVARVPFDPRSALISGMSLALLLRSGEPLVLLAAAFFAIASKFLIRVRGKHVFNPTNFAIVVAVYGTDFAWVSPGQWGSESLGAAAFVLAGTLILARAHRADVTLAFLLFWSAILFGRSLWLGEPMAIPLHRMQSGGLLLFAFFMLSDPRTLPDARAGRVLHALVVALVAAFIQFVLFRPNGLLIALVACAPLVPLFDRLLPALRYDWPGRRPLPSRREWPDPLAALALLAWVMPRSSTSPRRRS